MIRPAFLLRRFSKTVFLRAEASIFTAVPQHGEPGLPIYIPRGRDDPVLQTATSGFPHSTHFTWASKGRIFKYILNYIDVKLGSVGKWFAKDRVGHIWDIDMSENA
jgi:hypothetical protein